MQAKPEYRDRPGTEVAVLDALVERADEGMTVLELRTAVDADIDDLEEALAALKGDGLIHVDHAGESVRISPASRVVPETKDGSDDTRDFFEELRNRLGL